MAILLALPTLSNATVLGVPTFATQPRSWLQDSMCSDLFETFFNTDEFAVTALYTHASGESAQYKGIFDEDTDIVTFGASQPAMSVGPNFTMALNTCIRRPAENDRLTIQGRRFQVVTVHPDGAGEILLTLHQEDR